MLREDLFWGAMKSSKHFEFAKKIFDLLPAPIRDYTKAYISNVRVSEAIRFEWKTPTSICFVEVSDWIIFHEIDMESRTFSEGILEIPEGEDPAAYVAGKIKTYLGF